MTNLEIVERRLDLLSLYESASMMPLRPIVFGTWREIHEIDSEIVNVWIRRSRAAYRTEPAGVEIGGEA